MIAVKILKGFLSDQTEALPQENLSNRFVLRTKFLITSFRNGTRILRKIS